MEDFYRCQIVSKGAADFYQYHLMAQKFHVYLPQANKPKKCSHYVLILVKRCSITVLPCQNLMVIKTPKMPK